MNYDLVEKVLIDLKDIIPYKADIIWMEFKSITKLGEYSVKKNLIKINEYLDDEEEILNVMAHELIHACGIHGHGKEFKEYANKINSLDIGYHVTTTYEAKEYNMFKQKQAEARQKRKPSKEYIIWCPHCGWNRIYYRKNHHLEDYRCPKCLKSLKQKQYKPNTTIYTALN